MYASRSGRGAGEHRYTEYAHSTGIAYRHVPEPVFDHPAQGHRCRYPYGRARRAQRCAAPDDERPTRIAEHLLR